MTLTNAPPLASIALYSYTAHMSNAPTHNVHDSFFRATLSHKDVAADFLNNYLPAPVLQLIEMGSLAICKETFVDTKQAAHYSDLLYQVSLKDAKEGKEDEKAFVYVLFEHKSSPDPFTALQLLRYMLEIWTLFRKQHKNTTKLPLIIPVVVHHGKPKGKAVRLSDLVHIPDATLRGYVPDFDMNFYDFSPRASEDIRGQILLKSVLYCLKAVHHKQTNLMVLEIFKCINQLDDSEYTLQWMRIVWQYVAQAVNIEPREIAEIVQKNLSGKKKGEIMTLAQRLEQRGREEGMVLGRTEGRTEGMVLGRTEGMVLGRTEGRTEILTRLLTRKFGAQALTPAVEERLRLGTTDQLDHWGERILDAKSVVEVFMDN